MVSVLLSIKITEDLYRQIFFKSPIQKAILLTFVLLKSSISRFIPLDFPKLCRTSLFAF